MEGTAVRQISRIRRLGVLAALLTIVGQLIGPAVTAADAPPAGPADLARVGVPLEVTLTDWASEAAASVTLAPPLTLVPSDGKLHRVSIGGRRIAIWCRGTGSPTVILEHGIGYGVDSDSWEDVQEGIATETRVCRYDRAYVGESDDAKPGRSMPDLAEDLVELMHAALIPGPYILVGHSFGGLVVRNFAKAHPKDVVGMVLVDGSPRSAIVGLDLGSERLNRTKVLAQLLTLGSLGHLPLVVITRGIGLSASWRAEQAKMVKLSTSSRQVFATRSDHWIQLRQPDLVIRQVLTVVHTIRRHS
jgi:hypothetical protein